MKRKKIQIAIVDDQQTAIDELLSLLQGQDYFKVAFTTTDAREMLCLLNCIPVDILLTDITMPHMNGIELIKKVKTLYPKVAILTLSVREQEHIVNKLIEEGEISGNLLKTTGRQKLIRTLEKVGDSILFRNNVLGLPGANMPKKETEEKHLTERELEVVRLIEQEYTNKEIAETLFISERTVETHRKNIFRKTKTNSVIGLIKYAYEHKLV